MKKIPYIKLLVAIALITASLLTLSNFRTGNSTLMGSAIPMNAFKKAGSGIIFLRLDDIAGDVKDAEHTDWIEIEAFEFSNLQAGLMQNPTLDIRKVITKDIILTKRFDRSSPKLMEAVKTGALIPRAAIEVAVRAEGGYRKILTYVLQNVSISAYNVNASRETGVPWEKISLHYAEMQVVHTEYDEKGNPVGISGMFESDFLNPSQATANESGMVSSFPYQDVQPKMNDLPLFNSQQEWPNF